MGGLPCAHNGGSVAISYSTVAAQILRMNHSLMSADGMNHDFSLGFRSISDAFKKKHPTKRTPSGFFGSIFPGDFSVEVRPKISI
jgi:hypothetical protein